MRLEAGITFRRAERFHCHTMWPDRLRLNGGLVARHGALVPRDDWRPATVEELSLLVDAGATGAAADGCALLAIPGPLCQRWWEVAEQGAGTGELPGYDAFVAELADLLRFKGLPLPERCLASVVISRPGQASTRVAADGQHLLGVRFASLAPDGVAGGAPLALINLGDEQTYVVVLNLDAAAIARRCGEDAGGPDLLLPRFAERFPDYPLVRLHLEPGEGIWMPGAPVAFDGSTIGKSDVDALLVLHRADATAER